MAVWPRIYTAFGSGPNEQAQNILDPISSFSTVHLRLDDERTS